LYMVLCTRIKYRFIERIPKVIYYLYDAMSKRKIINDPIYGFVKFQFDLIYDIIDHPYFQRLRRISQMGLSNYVYPGAMHSRFAHALGAVHLMTESIKTLRYKGVDISDQEYLATCIAILLHDVGHGPFSHALENVIIGKNHEAISLDIMEVLNKEFSNQLDLAIKIFKGDYNKKYLTQLVSSQLDMDRMDYLTRDSYYSGVAEGVIGYKRIIAMLNVADDQLVVEEKGLYSVEKFLVARHIMYWQVYLHKASVCAEQMLKSFVRRTKTLLQEARIQTSDSRLHQILANDLTHDPHYLDSFTRLDDIDIYSELKRGNESVDPVIRILSDAIINRKLLGITLQDSKIDEASLESTRLKLKNHFNLDDEQSHALLIYGKESNSAYNIKSNEIKILSKQNEVIPISELMDIKLNSNTLTKYFYCYPKTDI
jgi:HD superfamily phosphohydrolase